MPNQKTGVSRGPVLTDQQKIERVLASQGLPIATVNNLKPEQKAAILELFDTNALVKPEARNRLPVILTQRAESPNE